MKQIFILTVLLVGLATACSKESSTTPGAEVSVHVDADKTKNSMENALDKTGEAIKDGANATKEKLKDAGEAVKDKLSTDKKAEVKVEVKKD